MQLQCSRTEDRPLYREPSTTAGAYAKHPALVAFARRVRAVRQAKDITAREMSRLMGVSPSVVSQWEIGRSAPPFHKIPDVAQFLGVAIEELFR